MIMGMGWMKRCRIIVLGLLVLAVLPKLYALEAEFSTSRGSFIVDLYPDRTPVGVAHFVRFAEGQGTWLDSRDGSVRGGDFYKDSLVTRVVNTARDRLFETGLVGGVVTDPGYGFPDEFHPLATHQPYVLSLANDGPNTNGTRIELTGSLAMSHRNGVNPVLGRIREGAGRAVVDSIISAGAGATVIHSISIHGKEPWATTLEESGERIPFVQAVNGSLKVQPHVSSSLHFAQPRHSVLAAWTSVDLTGWTPHFRRFLDSGITDLPESALFDHASDPSRFYQISLISYPVDPPPSGFSDLAGKTIRVEGPGIATIVYQFDETGRAGNFQNILTPGRPPFFSGPFTVDDRLPLKVNPYSLHVLVNTPNFGGSPLQYLKLGWDSATPNRTNGRHETQVLSSTLNPIFIDRGDASASDL